jgi:transcription antitermination factor NusG
MARRWYVVQTVPGTEAKVSQAIAEIPEQRFGSFLPMMEREISHARRKAIVKRPLFPNYTFAEFDAADEAEDDWPLILHVRGVHTILGIQRTVGIPSSLGEIRRRYRPRAPLALPPKVVPALKEALVASGGVFRLVSPKNQPLKPGSRVRVIDGPLEGLSGLVSYDRRQRVGVLLDMLGRKDAISIPRESIALMG